MTRITQFPIQLLSFLLSVSEAFIFSPTYSFTHPYPTQSPASMHPLTHCPSPHPSFLSPRVTPDPPDPTAAQDGQDPPDPEESQDWWDLPAPLPRRVRLETPVPGASPAPRAHPEIEEALAPWESPATLDCL